MTSILFMAALAGFGLEIHPGDAVRRTARESSLCGPRAGLRARIGELLAVGALLLVVHVALLLLETLGPVREPLRPGAVFLTGVALLAAGWHRISTTTRLNLRRSRLVGGADDPETPFRVRDGFLTEVRRPSWHVFWWAVVPGLALTAMAESIFLPPLVLVVYGGVALLWTAFLASRLGRGREKLVGTTEFRSMHSFGGLVLVGAAGLLFVESLGASGLVPLLITHVLKPLFGAG